MASGLTIDKASLDRVQRNIQRRLEQQKRDAERALDEEAASVGAESDANVPVDTGELKESRRIERRGLEASVGYTAPHALAVHEDLTASHDDGKAKFLEDAIRNRVSRFGRDIAQKIKI